MIDSADIELELLIFLKSHGSTAARYRYKSAAKACGRLEPAHSLRPLHRRLFAYQSSDAAGV